MFKVLGVTFIFILAWSCIPQASNMGAQCDSNTIYNPLTRSCDLPINLVVNPSLATMTMVEDAAPTYTELKYSDVENDSAISCSILTYTEGIDNFPPTACTCSSGTCYTYITPDLNFNGTAEFSYNIVDQDGTSGSKVVSITVSAVNDQPLAAASNFSVAEQSQELGDLSSLVTEVDIDQSVSYTLLSVPTNGLISGFNSSTGGYVFTPYDDDTTHSNDISFFQYQVCDNASPSLCNSAVVTVTVTPTNNAPLASNQFVTILEGVTTPFTITPAINVENDALTYSIIADAVLGTLTCVANSCSYDPTDDDYSGTDSFTYQVCDSYAACSSVVTVTITITALNDPPTAGVTPDVSVTEDIVTDFTLTAASDPESGGLDTGYALTYQIVTSPTRGSLSGCVLASGTGGLCIYTPDTNYEGSSGNDSFTYRVSDNLASSADTTVNLIFTAVNDEPTVEQIYGGSKFDVAPEWTAYTQAFYVDEGGGSYEDDQSLTLTATTSNSNIVNPSSIEFYYDVDEDYDAADDSTVDVSELLIAGALSDGVSSGDLYKVYMKIATGTVTGTATVTVSATDDGTGFEVGTMTFQVYVPQINAIHGGWKHISAVGKKVDKFGDDVTSLNTVRLEWHPFDLLGSGDATGDTIYGWNIFRRILGGSYDYTSPLNSSVLASTQYYYEDSTVSADQVYFYTVRPVDEKYKFSIPANGQSAEVRIISPPANMAFVHRWMVNQEVCLKMNQTITAGEIKTDENYRCEYYGPGETIDGAQNYYDIGHDMLVDLAEAGCPYTQAVDAPECGLNGCIGIGTPLGDIVTSATNANKLVYYNRASGECWKSTGAGSANWSTFLNTTLTATIADRSTDVLLPPLVNVSQAKALEFCNVRTQTASITGLTSTGTVTLPSRKEQLGYAAWNDLNTGYEDDEIAELEEGLEIDNVSKCNSSNANGLTVAYTSVPMPASPFGYSVPGTDGSLIRSIYTGSESLASVELTPDCVSRYGLQDVYGNVAEWVQDRVICDVSFTCTGTTTISNQPSAFVTTDVEMGTYAFDGVTGPCDEPGSCATAYMTEWTLDDDSNNNQAGYLLFPLALPVFNDFALDETDSLTQPYLLRIGSSAGITDDQLHDDSIIINAEILDKGNDIGGMAVGGSYLSGKNAGRYSMELVPATNSTVDSVIYYYYRDDIGFRCIIPVESTDYDTDANHSYSY